MKTPEEFVRDYLSAEISDASQAAMVHAVRARDSERTATTSPTTCPTCGGKINQEEIDTGCRVMTRAGKRGVRCGVTGAFVEPAAPIETGPVLPWQAYAGVDFPASGPTETGRPVCASWCNTPVSKLERVPNVWFSDSLPGYQRSFAYCSKECRDAGRPLNPARQPQTPCGTCSGRGFHENQGDRIVCPGCRGGGFAGREAALRSVNGGPVESNPCPRCGKGDAATCTCCPRCGGLLGGCYLCKPEAPG